MARIVFNAHQGGIGDQLLYSTLPERWVEQGHTVFIKRNFRNPGIGELCWGHNTFVSGIVDEPYTHIMHDDDKLIRGAILYENNIKAAEHYFGFGALNAYPKLYWEPQAIPRFTGKVLFDPTSVTVKIPPEVFNEFVAMLGRFVDLQGGVMLDCGEYEADAAYLPGIERVRTRDIHEYASMIGSCGTFVTVGSGGCAIASALRGPHYKPKTYALIPQALQNMKIWTWANINYFTTGRVLEDFQRV